jgi:hypothetical protein
MAAGELMPVATEEEVEELERLKRRLENGDTKALWPFTRLTRVLVERLVDQLSAAEAEVERLTAENARLKAELAKRDAPSATESEGSRFSKLEVD